VQVPPDDKRIKAEYALCPRRKGTAASRLPRAARERGQTTLRPRHPREIAASILISKMSRDGWRSPIFIAFAPDGLTSVGGYPGDDEKAATLFGQIDAAKMREDFFAAATWLKSRSDSTGRLGAIGFCFGGGIVNQLAVRMARTLPPPSLSTGLSLAPPMRPRSRRRFNAQYGELDTRITGGWPAFDAASRRRMCRTRAISTRGQSRLPQRHDPPLR